MHLIKKLAIFFRTLVSVCAQIDSPLVKPQTNLTLEFISAWQIMNKEFLPLNIAVMTISDTRTEKDDKSGKVLTERIKEAGHQLAEKAIVPDNIYKIREIVSRWIASEEVQVIITTGGTGVTGKDGTPEAIKVLLDKEIEGFGELFRWLSYQDIKTSTIQSRALGGVANGKYIFCLPGSSGACRSGWDQILEAQLDQRNRPCNFAELIPRLTEN